MPLPVAMEKLGHSTPAALRTYLGVDRRDVRRASIKVELGVSEQTFYTWRRKFAGMGVAELRELRQLRHENRKLKQLVADLSLDKHMLQEVLSKKV